MRFLVSIFNSVVCATQGNKMLLALEGPRENVLIGKLHTSQKRNTLGKCHYLHTTVLWCIGMFALHMTWNLVLEPEGGGSEE